MSSNIRIKRICLHCNTAFIAKTTVTKYCGDDCSKRAYKARIRNVKVEESNREMSQISTRTTIFIADKNFLTVKDAAILLNSSAKAIRRMINDGMLTGINFAMRKTLIRRVDIDRLFETERLAQNDASEGRGKSYKIKECYTIAEAEKRAGMSGKAFYAFIKRNNIPKIQQGKFVYVPKIKIDRIFKGL
ncbi:helix-turn-helix domain-containing protein [Mucilaginibacter gynuensis]|uniref:Helix-turn-helix domain-containing protein n=1 Tax=Mucilaginibacter gynuensis TaxID=1302236 RepID=A0ABP8HI15_9SPHI